MSENENENKKERMYIVALPILLALLTGGGTVIEWKLPDLPAMFPSPAAGSLLVGVISAIGIVYLLVTLRSLRSWGIVVVGYLLDLLLSLAFMWPIRELAVPDPLGPWPYILGTTATFLAGIAVGLMAPRVPLRHASGIVSIDLVLAGISGFFLPQAATWILISRVVAAYCAAGLGALIGQYARFVLRKEPEALGKFLGATVMACVTATLAGVLTAVALELLKKP